MSSLKEILINQIKKSIIPLIIFAMLSIFNYGSDEFNFLKLKEEIIPPATATFHRDFDFPDISQECGAGMAPEWPRPNPDTISLTPDLSPFKIGDRLLIKELLDIKIQMDPLINNDEEICFNYITQEYDVRKKVGASGPIMNKLKLEIKSNRLVVLEDPDLSNAPKINLKDPIIKHIDPNGNNILQSLESKCTKETNKINCSIGSTTLSIDYSKEEKNFFVGESATNPNKGIIIISEKTRTAPMVVEACEKEKKTTYTIHPDTVIEIDCQ